MTASMPSSSVSSQCLFGGFAGLDLAAGKFPFRGERLVGAALADEHLVSAQDQRDHNLPHRTNFGAGAGGRFGVGFRLRICPVLVCH